MGHEHLESDQPDIDVDEPRSNFGPAAAGVMTGVAAFGIHGAYLIAAVFSVVSTLLTMRLPKLEPKQLSRASSY